VTGRKERDLNEAVFEVLPEAKRLAGASVAVRTLFYKVRPLIQRFTAAALDYKYFSQKLLPKYQRTVAEEVGVVGAHPVLFFHPGEVVEPDLGPDLAMLVENTAADRYATLSVVPQMSYAVVHVQGAAVVHAGAVTHHAQRSVVSRWTLCSASKSRRVHRRLRGADLETVTCSQCRRRLEKAGVLQPRAEGGDGHAD
jgi:hypothetical protein